MLFIFPEEKSRYDPKIGSKKMVSKFWWLPVVIHETDSKKLLWLERASIEYTYIRHFGHNTIVSKTGSWKPTKIVNRGD